VVVAVTTTPISFQHDEADDDDNHKMEWQTNFQAGLVFGHFD
jgi:hypothetical protein